MDWLGTGYGWLLMLIEVVFLRLDIHCCYSKNTIQSVAEVPRTT